MGGGLLKKAENKVKLTSTNLGKKQNNKTISEQMWVAFFKMSLSKQIFSKYHVVKNYRFHARVVESSLKILKLLRNILFFPLAI